ncbi:hypothetical protein GGI17_005546 [Coemansia sp. S146]|nr:hypothetical protein GGI17_005546 [Coemansia sp. S146]
MVVNHVSHCGSQILAESKALLMPLLWVCRNFRAVVYSQHSGSFYVGLDRRLDKLSTTWTASSGFYVYSDYHEHHFARKLVIYLDEHSVYSGKMLDMMLEKSYCAGAFPMVRSMELHFSTLLDSEESNATVPPLSEIPDIEANVNAFLRHTKLVAPKAKDVSVSGLFGHESTPTIPYHYTQNLLAQLFMLTYRIGFHDRYWTMPFDLPVNDIRNMVHINYQFYNGMGLIASLARLCASTLESLAIKGGEFEDISGLIRNDDALPDTYMSLWEVLSLIKSLPLLTDMHTMEAHIHPLPSGLTASELPAYVLTNYGSTSNRLQCWHLSSIEFKVEVCAMCLLLLALVCPNFSSMTHRDLKPKKVLKKMVEFSNAGDFKQHSQRLERLFSKWQHVENIVAHGSSPLLR